MNTLDERWIETTWWPSVLCTWRWPIERGVFSYALLRDPQTNKWTVAIEDSSLETIKYLGPFSKHATATNHVVKHIQTVQGEAKQRLIRWNASV